jgi:beta-1,2-mannosidase
MKNTLVALSFLLLLQVFSACGGSKKALADDRWTLGPLVKMNDYNPILEADPKPDFYCPIRKKNLRWEEKDVFNPTAVVKDGRMVLLYRAQDRVGKPSGTSRIGLARSTDGITFRKNPIPVVHPDRDKMKDYEWEGGCEDPRVVKREDGLYVMTYTAYDGGTARLCVTTSVDLLVWEKRGLAFSAKKYRDTWSKSGAIVCELVNGEIVARKIGGKYWMYWGDTDIFMATSEDMISWKPVERKGDLVRALSPRPGFFDSRLVEPGPFALLRKEGILLLYNSANSASNGDKTLSADTYSVGQALFSAKKPGELRARSNQNFLTPDQPYELTGQVNNVCFLEGMAWYGGRWLLYYGTADSKIAVAECRER